MKSPTNVEPAESNGNRARAAGAAAIGARRVWKSLSEYLTPPWNAKAAKAAKKFCRSLRPWRPLRSIVTFSLGRRVYCDDGEGLGEQIIAGVAQKGIPEIWLNPGAESDALIARAEALQLRPIVACSLIAIG